MFGIWTGLPTTIPFSHNPIFGNEKSQPIPTSGILFLNQFPKMGLKFSTNSQCGKVKFNQFPVSNGIFFQPIPILIVLLQALYSNTFNQVHIHRVDVPTMGQYQFWDTVVCSLLKHMREKVVHVI